MISTWAGAGQKIWFFYKKRAGFSETANIFVKKCHANFSLDNQTIGNNEAQSRAFVWRVSETLNVLLFV